MFTQIKHPITEKFKVKLTCFYLFFKRHAACNWVWSHFCFFCYMYDWPKCGLGPKLFCHWKKGTLFAVLHSWHFVTINYNMFTPKHLPWWHGILILRTYLTQVFQVSENSQPVQSNHTSMLPHFWIFIHLLQAGIHILSLARVARCANRFCFPHKFCQFIGIQCSVQATSMKNTHELPYRYSNYSTARADPGFWNGGWIL